MRADKHFSLHTLGRLSLEAHVGEIATVPAVRPRHLALLAVLALSPRAVRRESLAAMFWGEDADERARHSLSNALSALRSVLGPAAITARRDEVALSAELRLAVDAVEFTAAAESRDDARAAALYSGPFLDDVVVPDAPGFASWADGQRARLERQFLAICERRVPALLRARTWDDCAELSERWLRCAPGSPVAFTSLLRARSGPDTPAAIRAALADFARMRDWVWAEHGLRVDASVGALASELESRLAMTERATTKVLGASSAAEVLVPEPARRRKIRIGARGWAAIAAMALLVPVGPLLLLGRPKSTIAAPAHTIIAITDIANVRGDTSLTWLQDGLPQLIADDIAATGSAEAVPRAQIRDLLLRRGTRFDAPLTQSEAMDIATRVHAAWAVRGGLTGGPGVYILDVDVRDVGSGRSVESFTVMAADPLRLGRLAAARLLDVAGRSGGRTAAPPRFADAATTEPEAYQHYVLGLEAQSEGRASDAVRELDAAVGLDSGFIGAASARRDIAGTLGQHALAARLDSLIARHRDRMTEWDYLTGEIWKAMYDGAVVRSEALAARLTTRFARDPRAYDLRANVLATHGRWLEADTVYQQELALDSLAMEAGQGPCAPCVAYNGLVVVRLANGDASGALRAARRWVALQPAVPGAWQALGMALEYNGEVDEAMQASRRAALLGPEAGRVAIIGRMALVAHDFHTADSIITVLRTWPQEVPEAADLAMMLARERGQFRRASELLGPHLAGSGLDLVQADNFARAGRLSDARRLYERSGHAGMGDVGLISATQARGFAWAHALEGDALWRAGDTAAVVAIMDSLRRVGERSYYGRDWVLHHHLAGLLALSRGDTARAERELWAARWGVAGWTVTVLQLGQLRLARGDARGALALLRQASEAPLDAMGRYVPRTELEFWFARAFGAAGERDSARVYATRVREAWAQADPEVRRRLALLP